LNSLAIEIVTSNPNYHMIIVTQILFECPNSGAVEPLSTSRALPLNSYNFARSSADRFRVVLEVIFIIFILIQDFKRVKTYVMMWKESYAKVSISLKLSLLSDSLSRTYWRRIIGDKREGPHPVAKSTFTT